MLFVSLALARAPWVTAMPHLASMVSLLLAGGAAAAGRGVAQQAHEVVILLGGRPIRLTVAWWRPRVLDDTLEPLRKGSCAGYEALQQSSPRSLLRLSIRSARRDD